MAFRENEKKRLICLDCETTGLDVNKDRVIEVAAVCFDMKGTYGKFETLVNPGCTISPASIKIHHITQDMVVDKPAIQEVLSDLFEFVGDHPIVGHGILFDIDILAVSAGRENIPTTMRKNLRIDTLRMARIYGESQGNSLEDLRKHFHIEQEIAHRAMSDVIVNIEVFKRLAEQYSNLEKLFEVLSRPILLKDMPLGKHKGRPLKEIPLQYLKWAASKNFDQDLLYSIRTELKKRKKGDRFSQATNPFQHL
ncbi:MAG: DUF3820 family protein [Waddliaceae bacterium]